MTVTSHRETHHSKCSKCLLLALRHVIKQSCHWSVNWSMKLCCSLTIFQSDAISAHGHTSLVSDKHVPVFRFQLVSAGMVHWCVFHAARGESEWCIGLWCLLLKQLLPYICQAAGDFYFPVHKTPYFTPDMQLPNRPDLTPVDYGIWTVILECIYQKQQVSSYTTDNQWLLTEWHLIFHKVG